MDELMNKATIGVITLSLTGFALFLVHDLAPKEYERVSVGVVTQIEPTGPDGTIVTTEKRRYAIAGTWVGLVGQPAEYVRPASSNNVMPFSRQRNRLCVEKTDKCYTVTN